MWPVDAAQSRKPQGYVQYCSARSVVDNEISIGTDPIFTSMKRRGGMASWKFQLSIFYTTCTQNKPDAIVSNSNILFIYV